MFSEKLVNSEPAKLLVAMELQKLGLKLSILTDLTGVPKTTLKRYAKDIGIDRSKSPRGHDFTLKWFFKDKVNMVHSTNVLRFYQEYSKDNTVAIALLKTYYAYQNVISTAIFNINHMALLIKYFNAALITIETCKTCAHHYIHPSDEITLNCMYCFEQRH